MTLLTWIWQKYEFSIELYHNFKHLISMILKLQTRIWQKYEFSIELYHNFKHLINMILKICILLSLSLSRYATKTGTQHELEQCTLRRSPHSSISAGAEHLEFILITSLYYTETTVVQTYMYMFSATVPPGQNPCVIWTINVNTCSCKMNMYNIMLIDICNLDSLFLSNKIACN